MTNTPNLTDPAVAALQARLDSLGWGETIKTVTGKGPQGAKVGVDLNKDHGGWIWFHSVESLDRWVTEGEAEKSGYSQKGKDASKPLGKGPHNLPYGK